ncbi:hypothetical protein BU25DRAFT_81695 [Macroventuria anomochaeta]|uniref:Uncharacterized protein n=1 Tax=Macroventuria anomochaeta TaxID=301207 RepID=A0ACB6SEU9_9PLEO|nr:uncharacterized protein BU25DRAFT_81695 [Macroventuria anomochaeta]KAF2632746.1 hypothetical protein BU25DRAFT_81695 [Macroventuria anomochaeta]
MKIMLGALGLSLWRCLRHASALCKATCEAVQGHKRLTPTHENGQQRLALPGAKARKGSAITRWIVRLCWRGWTKIVRGAHEAKCAYLHIQTSSQFWSQRSSKRALNEGYQEGATTPKAPQSTLPPQAYNGTHHHLPQPTKTFLNMRHLRQPLHPPPDRNPHHNSRDRLPHDLNPPLLLPTQENLSSSRT